MPVRQAAVVEHLEARFHFNSGGVVSHGSHPNLLPNEGAIRIRRSTGVPFFLLPVVNSSTLPSALAVGTAAQSVVNLSLVNAGGLATPKPLYIQIEAVLDGNISGPVLGSMIRNVSIRIGGTCTSAMPVRIGQHKLTAGSYTLLVIASTPIDSEGDSYSTPNVPTGGPAFVVGPPIVSLSESVAKSTLPASTAGNSLSNGTVTLSLTNTGNFTTPGKTTVALFATATGSVHSLSTKLASITRPLRIIAGKSIRLTLSLRRIPAIPVGSYQLVAQVTDPRRQLTSVVVELLTITA